MRYQVGIPDVFKWSIGETTEIIPDGWRGVVALHYGEGWIEVNSRYRWTRDELLAVSGVVGRMWRMVWR